MLRFDPVLVAEDGQPLDDISQFADIARPRVAFHLAHRLGLKALDLDLILLAETLQERDRQQGDVALPLAQRRQKDRHHIEPIIEVFAKLALGTISVRSRLVAAIRRMSISRSAVSPTFLTRLVSSTRSSLPWVSMLRLPTSSRKSVPWWAASKSPCLVAMAPRRSL